MGWHVIVERYTDELKTLPLDVGGLGVGVPLFAFSFQARRYIEDNWESLGPGWEPLELKADKLVYVLEQLADAGKAQWVIVEFPPSDTPLGVTQEPGIAAIREFIAVMKGEDE